MGQAREIYQKLPYSVDFTVPGSFEIHWVRQYLTNVVLFGIKDLYTPEVTVKPKSTSDL